MSPPTKSSQPSQRGFVLVIGLVVLMVLTVIGVTSMRGTTLQERMAANTQEHQIAFEAAEAALRAAKDLVEQAASPAALASENGYQPNGNARLWKSIFVDGRPPAGSYGTVNAFSRADSKGQPHAHAYYIIQKLKDTSPLIGSPQTCHYYRITAEGTGRAHRFSVVLQTYYPKGC